MARTLNNKRILSYSIDILVVTSLLAAGVALAPWLGRSLEIVLLCYAIFYALFRDSFNGAGIGKRTMGLQVVRTNARGETVPAEMGIAVVRELCRCIPILNLIDFCLVAFTPDRQQFSDRILGFSVIENKDKPVFHFSKATLIPVALPALVATWIILLPLKENNQAHVALTLPDQLTEASAAGNVEQIEKLVKAGTNPNATNTSGQTPLQLAAVSGRFEAVKSLLALGADVCIKTNILQPGGEKLIDLLNRINSATDRDIASNQDLEKMRRAIASQDCGGHFDQAKFQKALSSDE